VRGNRIGVSACRLLPRSIPACAGEPAITLHVPQDRLVYPRVCGGTSVRTSSCPVTSGLSPRVRGNRILHLPQLARRRSIPACAGEPIVPTGLRNIILVYPRVCGGTQRRRRPLDQLRGLSPRVRGNQTAACDGSGAERSIPACAGEPWREWKMMQPTAVYPRVCGGTDLVALYEGTNEGLSPRVRGNPKPVGDTIVTHRSIPACAGEPHFAGRGHYQRKVYPRVCGGTTYRKNRTDALKGLSPRVRGNLTSLAVAT